ncbi:hypothetical protein Tco_1045699 [Tanacetum coccineum]|uniref:Reverse transcriptase domain-containing protein n=1 Tax=Tanacetum coccineum TaxID=301880 RepID=A0ABQ5GUK4_9ASTR
MVVEGEVLNDSPRFVGILIMEFAAGGAVNFALKMKGDMIIKNLDLKLSHLINFRSFFVSCVMYIMTSRPWTHVSVQVPFGGVTDWYQNQGYREQITSILQFKMSVMGKISFFLGLQNFQSPSGIFLNQSKYALESLKKYGMESSDPVDTPMVEKSKLDKDPQGKVVDPTHYRRMAKPTKKYLHAIKRIFKYLRGTVNRGLWYPKDSSIALTAYADAAYPYIPETCITIDRDVVARVDAGIDMEVDVGVDVEDEVESSDRGTMEVRVDVVVRIDIPDGILMPNVVERLEQVEEGLQDIYEHVMEIPLQRIHDIKMRQRELEARSLIAGGDKASLLKQVASLERSNARLRGTMMMERARADRFRRREIGDIRCEAFRFSSMRLCMDFRIIVELVDSSSISNMTITRSGMTSEVIKELINQRVEEALAAYEATHAANALESESQSQNGSDGDNGNGGNGNGGDGNGGNVNGGNGHLNENNRGARLVAQECTYQDFIKCQPLNFKGTKGVVGLIRWFEKTKTVFHISNCPEKCHVKYATCTLLNNSLTWWNSHKRTIGTEAAFSMSWKELMKLMAKGPPAYTYTTILITPPSHGYSK